MFDKKFYCRADRCVWKPYAICYACYDEHQCDGGWERRTATAHGKGNAYDGKAGDGRGNGMADHGKAGRGKGHAWDDKGQRGKGKAYDGKNRKWQPVKKWHQYNVDAVHRDGLQGSNAKIRKAQRGLFGLCNPTGERAGARGPAASAPPPPLCNRVGKCKWSSSGSPCHCDQWPQWLLTHGRSRAKAIATCEGNVDVDPDDAKSLPVTNGCKVSYLRPKGTASS